MPVVAVAGKAGCGKDTVADYLDEQAKERGQRVVRLKFAGALRQDLIECSAEVQAFWHQLHRALTEPSTQSPINDEPLIPESIWDKCLPGFRDLREHVQNNAIKKRGSGGASIFPSNLAPVPADVINTSDRAVKESPNAACGGLSPRVLMQAYGSYMRNVVDEDYWTNRLLQNAQRIQADEPDTLIIITDLRYENEALAVRETLAGRVVHVVRSNSEVSPHGAAADHESEAGIAVEHGDTVLSNSGTLDDLREAARCITTFKDHPLLSMSTLWGTPHTIATAFAALKETASINRLVLDDDFAQMLKKNNSLLSIQPSQIEDVAPHAPKELETLLVTSRHLAEPSPMGTVLQVLAERVAMRDEDALDAFEPLCAFASLASESSQALQNDLEPEALQGHLDAVIERAVLCRAIANGDVEEATLTLERMLEAFYDDDYSTLCELLAHEAIARPLRESAHAPSKDATSWLQQANECGLPEAAILTSESASAITALLHYEPNEEVAHAAVQHLLERGDEIVHDASFGRSLDCA